MRLTCREGRRDDFEAWFAMELACYVRGDEWRDNAVHEWHALFDSGVLHTLAVEDLDRPKGKRLVAFGGAAFVTPEFAAWLWEADKPYFLIHATRPMPDGSSPLLAPDAVRAANAGEGLDCIITHWNWAEPPLSPEEGVHARTFLAEQFAWVHGGYKLRSLFTEGFGPTHFARAESTGFRLITDFRAYFDANPPAPPPRHHPYLFGITRKEALARDGSAVLRHFLYSPPRCNFSKDERAILLLARLGTSDAEIRKRLFLSEGLLKKRWGEIYGKADAAVPGLLPPAGNETRGRERRRELIAYLRGHPEELRPLLPLE